MTSAAASPSGATNLGVSAETLKVVLRQRDFATTEKFYGAIRSAQSAAQEVRGKLAPSCDASAFVRGLVGGHEKAPRLSTEELRKLKEVIHSLELSTPHWIRTGNLRFRRPMLHPFA